MRTNFYQTTLWLRWTLVLLLPALAQQMWGQCTNTTQYPSGTVAISTTGAVTTISSCSFAGEYSVISGAVAGQTLAFSTGVAGDIITVRSGSSSGPVIGFGNTPLTFSNTYTGTIYAHWNTAGCGSQSVCRTTTVQCTSCSAPPAPCTNITQYPSGTVAISTTGAVTTISSCSFAGEYSVISGAVAGQTLKFTSSVGTDYITVRSGTSSGPVLASGTTPLTFSNTYTGTIYAHWNTPGCGSESACRTTTVQCTSCLAPPAPANDNCATATSLTSNTSCVTTSGTTVGATSSLAAITCATFTGTADDDVWYSFVAAAATQTITVVGAAGFDAVLDVRSGACNGTNIGCADGTTGGGTETAVVNGLTIGATYYVRVYSFGSLTSNQGTFTICVTHVAVSTPPCVASPTSPANGANAGICPGTSTTLTFPASPGATSYDIYFGTATTPPFVANVATNSYVTGNLAAGTYYWQVRPRNVAGPAAGCNIWSFTVADIVAPSITCPANVVANNTTNLCSAVVTYGSTSATDNCSAPLIVLVSGGVSGSSFAVGVNTIVFRATDLSGNTATCSFTVTVNDTQLPNITCPANITKANDLNACSAVTTFTTPTATDNCGIQSVTLTGGLTSGSAFPVGVTTNTFRALDLNGNTRTCSFTITVNDTQKPTITCPANLTKNNDPGQCGKDISFLGSPTLADNCGFGPLTNNSPGFFGIGTTTVNYTFFDNHGNSATCTQTVTVKDYEFPVITCPTNISQVTDENDCAAVVDFAAFGTDNCPGSFIEYSIDPQSTFDIGFTNVNARITDASGNSIDCNFQVNINTREELCNDYDDDCDGLIDEAQQWDQVIKAVASDGGTGDQFGVSVDIDGDWAVVGSREKNAGGQVIGSVFVMQRDSNSASGWTQAAKLSSQSSSSDLFGTSVAIDAVGIVAVGAPEDDEAAPNAGAVYIYQNSAATPTVWTLVKKALAGDAGSGDNFGHALSLSGARLLVGADLDDEKGVNAGAAYIFVQGQGGPDNWGQVAKMTATDGEADDHLGTSVSLDGSRALVGATGDDDKGQDAGAAYMFARNQGGPNVWGQQAKLTGNNSAAGDNFGVSVALSGLYALVGADQFDASMTATNVGRVYSFYRNKGGVDAWGQNSFIYDYNGSKDDHYGIGVDLDGDYAVVASRYDNPHGFNSGSAFVYMRQEDGWVLMDQLDDNSGQSNDQFGAAVALSGRSIIIGSPLDDVSGNTDRGSASIFEGLCSPSSPREGVGELALVSGNLAVRCFPVPFSDNLTVEVSAQASDVRISIINALGQEVTMLHEGALNGLTNFHWQAGHNQPGMYFLRVQAGNEVQTKAILLARP